MKTVIGKKDFNHEINKQAEHHGRHAAFATLGAANKTEIKRLRGSRSKFFSMGDRKMMAELHDAPIHYYDPETAEFKELEVGFNENDDMLETKAHPFRARFNKKPTDGKVFEMQKGKCKICLTSQDAAISDNLLFRNADCDGQSAGKVLFENVRENTDIEYVVTPERMKENIIIRKKAESYQYNFSLTLENVVVDVSPDGKNLELRDSDSKSIEFIMPAPYMFDAKGEYSDAVYYEIEQQSSDELKIKVVADSDWINSQERTFPVTVDPTIYTTEYSFAYGADYYGEEYEDSIFRYKVFEGENEVGGNLRLRYNGTDPIITSKIYVSKDTLDGNIIENCTQVFLTLRATDADAFEGVVVNGACYIPDENGEVVADITTEFKMPKEEAEIILDTGGYGFMYYNDVTFYPPSITIVYNNYVESIRVVHSPLKKTYFAGEAFDPTGMIVHVVYSNGLEMPITDYEIYPYDSLATYDEGIYIRYDGMEVYYKCLTVKQGWYNDRRPTEGMENVYSVQEVDKDGNPVGAEVKYVRLLLCDGANGNANREGTPLNAKTLNTLKVLAENVVGSVSEEDE